MKALLEQAKVRVIGCVVNKQRRSRKDTPKSYGYRAGKRSKRGSRSKQSTSYPAAPLVTSGVVSKQSAPPLQSARVELKVTKQATSPSELARTEPKVTEQSTPPSEPVCTEPTVTEQSTPPPQPNQDGQNNGRSHENNGRNHDINNGKSSPAVSVGAALVEADRDQTIPLNGGKIGDLREDG
jgi:hypothetical protein